MPYYIRVIKRESFIVSVIGWLVVLAIWTVVSSVSVVAAFIFTNPVTIGPAGVTVWFLLLFSAICTCVTLALYSAKTYLHVHGVRAARLRYSWRQGLLVGGWVAALMALRSLHQLTSLDAILLGLLMVIIEVYVRFRWP